MRRSLVVGNWKMNGSREKSRALLADILSGLVQFAKADVGVCPPSVYLPDAAELLKNSSVLLGSQNVADQDEGAFTGEISALMLNEFGCSLAIVGHSERRMLYGESSALVAARYAKAIQHGLIPILCIGETLAERESDRTFDVIGEQLDAVLSTAGVASLAKAVIAYEPVWAIGTGMTASTEQAQEVHAWIRARIAKLDASVAEKLQILYGGSVKPDNASALFSMPDIDGGLIGGASLDANSFLKICLAA
ncbi:MAG: triose-phosphate isomerase [Proteobacteria bacterium]|nr:triose-phosphate isomerase [Pseudomonadota bacterium]